MTYVCAMILTIFAVSSVFAEEINTDGTTEKGGDIRDTVRAGHAFSNAYWDYLEMRVSYWDEKTEIYNRIEATLNLDHWITKLKINNELILSISDEPLPGIPVPEGGMRNVSVSVTGYRSGHPKVHGGAFLSLVDEEHPINVMLRPLDVILYIPYTSVPAGVNDPHELLLQSLGGSWVGYYTDTFAGYEGFIFYVDPTIDPIFVSIIDRTTGKRYGNFEVDPLEGAEADSSVSANFDLVGKVHRFHFSDGRTYATLGSKIDGFTKLDSPIDEDGDGVVYAKSFIYENSGDAPLRFYAYGPATPNSEIRLTAYKNGEENNSITVLSSEFDDYIGHGVSLEGEDNDDEYSTAMFTIEVLRGEATGEFYFELSKYGWGGKG